MEPLASREEVAEFLKINPRTLDNWASLGRGPVYVKVGGSRRYDWADVHDWAESRKIDPGRPRYVCSGCRKPVRNNGHLVVSIAQAVQVKKDQKAFDEYLASKPFPVIEDDDWDRVPDLAPWTAAHRDCRPAVPTPYFIEVERVNTWSALARFVAHILEKDWARHTDVSDLLREAGAE